MKNIAFSESSQQFYGATNESYVVEVKSLLIFLHETRNVSPLSVTE